MSLHALDLQNRHNTINNFTPPVEDHLAPATHVEQAHDANNNLFVKVQRFIGRIASR